MGKNLLGWFRDRSKKNTTQIAASKAVSFDPVERLESRTMFAAVPVRVATVIADSRGQVEIRFTKALASTTIFKKIFRLYLPGTDGVVNTPDDVQATASIKYDATTKTLTLKATTEPTGTYRVKVFSSGTIDTDGLHLDGEYNSTLPSGNGVQGGNFQFKARADTGTLPTARITTNLGLITLRLNKTAAPLSVANFIAYANSGRYDSTFIHRNSKSEAGSTIDVIQGGAFKTNFTSVPAFAPIALEAGLPNNRGTISMARQDDSAGTATATSSFFLNVTDNPELNPNNGLPGWSQNGYAVFGTITSGLPVLDKIYAQPTQNLGSGTLNAPIINGKQNAFVTFSRVAMQDKIYALDA